MMIEIWRHEQSRNR